MRQETNIAILGGGVAGLVTAICLHERGFRNITIYERRSSVSTQGAGLVLWPNAISIFEKIDLLNDLKVDGHRLSAMQRWTDHGEFLNSIDIGIIEQDSGYPSYSISRSMLHEVLIKKINGLRIKIEFDFNVHSIHQHGNTTQVAFENGDTINPDIVIGAEGRMDSKARLYVNGNNSPVYQNYVNWVGLTNLSLPSLNPDNILDFWGCGLRFGIVPISEGRVYWAGCKAMPKSNDSTYAHQEVLLKTFKDWPVPIKQIIKATPQAFIKRIEVYDHHPIENWYRDNVCIIGDAAHAALPTSGQGACQAIEDAWHLSDCLYKCSGNINNAFYNFQKLRMSKTSIITLRAREFAAVLFDDNAEQCNQRNERAKQVNTRMQAKAMAKEWSN